MHFFPMVLNKAKTTITLAGCVRSTDYHPTELDPFPLRTPPPNCSRNEINLPLDDIIEINTKKKRILHDHSVNERGAYIHPNYKQSLEMQASKAHKHIDMATGTHMLY